MFLGIFSRLARHWIAPHEVRAESWALGGRHQGRVLEGARSELRIPGLPLRRAILLKAVIRAERTQAPRSGLGPQ